MNITQIIGAIGTTLVFAAYIPQVAHLIKEKCSAGISRKAFLVWLVSSAFLFIHSLSSKDVIVMILQVINFSATLIILIYATKYKDHVCETHQHQLTSKEIG